jgi:hypothetical protein
VRLLHFQVCLAFAETADFATVQCWQHCAGKEIVEV